MQAVISARPAAGPGLARQGLAQQRAQPRLVVPKVRKRTIAAGWCGEGWRCVALALPPVPPVPASGDAPPRPCCSAGDCQ